MTEQWRSEKVRRPRGVVEPWIAILADHFHKQNVQFEFGGSWRRGAAVIGDIDVIVVTRDGSLESSLFDQGVELPRFVRWDRPGPKIAQGSIVFSSEPGDELHVDVWAVKPAEFGAFMWFVTGPVELNIKMRQLALRKGMSLSQIGLLRTSDKQQLDDGTERGVALTLGFPWIEPADRQRFAEPAQEVRAWKVDSSKGDKQYDVRLDSTGWSCSCPQFMYRSAQCKHIAAVRVKHPDTLVSVLS